MFLFGWAFNEYSYGVLYGRQLNANFVKYLFRGVRTIYFYGPDIAYIEKFFGLNIRTKFETVNLIPVFRKALPHLNCHKLACLEKHFNLPRTTEKYKKNIFQIYEQWHSNRQEVIKYNLEDVLNMMKIHKTINSNEFNQTNKTK